jgi:hypothetical protein
MEQFACRFCKRSCRLSHSVCENDGWCFKCKAKGLVANFNNWTSGDSEIDAFIQKTQKEAVQKYDYLEWIDPQQIADIKHIFDGDFGSVYQATWKNAPERFGDRINDEKVALQTISSDATTFFEKVNAVHCILEIGC